jgi:hypothetical protein
METRDLPLLDEGLDRRERGVGHWLHRPARQDFGSLVRIARKMPAIVKHRLGEPFIGKVLQEIIEEGDGRV